MVDLVITMAHYRRPLQAVEVAVIARWVAPRLMEWVVRVRLGTRRPFQERPRHTPVVAGVVLGQVLEMLRVALAEEELVALQMEAWCLVPMRLFMAAEAAAADMVQVQAAPATRA